LALTPSYDQTVRTQWKGKRTSNPPSSECEEGAWWYRTDLKKFAYWDGTQVLYWGAGINLFSGSSSFILPSAGNYALNVTVAGATTIDHVLDIQLEANPTTDPGTPEGVFISGNVVGFTLIGVGQGTTLTATCKVSGS